MPDIVNNYTNEQLASAAYADVQTSPTDTMIDALMAVGAFGLGAEDGPLITDFNDAERSGFYSTASTANNPAGLGTAFGMLHVVSRSSGNTVQVFTQSTAAPIVYNRVQTGGVWSDWVIDYNNANYQPLEYKGIGHTLVARNVSGSAVLSGGTVDGSLLEIARWSVAGAIESNTVLDSGDIYMNMSRQASDDQYSTFTRVS